MNNKKYGLFAGLIVIAITTLVYLLSFRSLFDWPMCWFCFSALILSEFITICAYLFLNLKRVTIAVVFTLQTVFTLILAVIFVNLFVFAYASFFILYFLSLAVAAVISVLTMGFISSSSKKNEEFKNAKMNMLTIRTMVNGMMNSENGRKYYSLLSQLDENLRFTDDSVSDGLDNAIYEKVRELSINIGSPDCEVDKAVENINALIKQRNFLVKSRKSY